MARLFGTDGIRGVANSELTPELTMKVGAAGAFVLGRHTHKPKILVGMDTRRSGEMLSAALMAGICSVGGSCLDVGVIPTPAMAYLVRRYSADAAVMISASHNTMEYNGIKWFDGRGFKLPDAVEDEIEAVIKDGVTGPRVTGAHVGNIMKATRAIAEYSGFLAGEINFDLNGLTIALDCSNGAASAIAGDVFRRGGAKVFSFCDEPDGLNINDHCGSTHPERLSELVIESGADIGFAFDGDADRLIACDELGAVIDGDRTMGICAAFMKQRGTLKGNTLVLTVMSNIGLKKRMAELGIDVSETAVGDRYVLENMLKNGYSIGGEQSGHVIFLDKNTTGDGMLTAIQLINILASSGKKASELAGDITIYPQVLRNVRVDPARKHEAMECPEMLEQIIRAEGELGGAGRVLVRASGTEPLIRVMLEGPDEATLGRLAESISQPLITGFAKCQ